MATEDGDAKWAKVCADAPSRMARAEQQLKDNASSLSELATRLAGNRLLAARYGFPSDSAMDDWYQDHGAWHVLDFGLELEFERGGWIHATWAGSAAYYVKLAKGGLATAFEPGRVHTQDAATTGSWPNYIGRRVDQLRAWRQRCEADRFTESAKTLSIPVELQFDFDDGSQLWMSTRGYDERAPEGPAYADSDNVLVTFGAAAAAQLRLGSGGLRAG